MAFQHHMPGCPHSGEETQIASGGYFCDCHKFSEPQIGPDGRDVAFPAGWTEIEVQEWRQKNHLAPPSAPGSGPWSNSGTPPRLRALTCSRCAAGQQATGVFVEERDFWHVAQHLIRLHGEQAEFDAALRAERARLAGDRTGHEIWRLVMYKVSALQHEPAPSELQ